MKEIETIQAAIDGMDQRIQAFIESSNEEVVKHGELGKKHTETLASLESQFKDLKDAHDELAQKSDNPQGMSASVLTPGEQIVQSDLFASFASGGTNKARIAIQANTVTGSDTIVAPDRRDFIIEGARRQLRVSDVLPQLTTTQQSVEITRESTVTNNAAETAEGAQKPETDITYDLVTTPIRTVPHFIKISRQVMDDAPLIVSHINSLLVYGVEFRVDQQLLTGDGIGQNISGMMTAGNLTAFTPTGTDPIVSIRQAITDVLQADYSATAVILNPADVETIDLTTETGGLYVASNPRTAQAGTIWGLPIVETNAQTAGQFIVAAFPVYAAQINRTDTVVEMSDSDENNFQLNLVTIRAERRVGLGIWRPASAVGGALST